MRNRAEVQLTNAVKVQWRFPADNGQVLNRLYAEASRFMTLAHEFRVCSPEERAEMLPHLTRYIAACDKIDLGIEVKTLAELMDGECPDYTWMTEPVGSAGWADVRRNPVYGEDDDDDY